MNSALELEWSYRALDRSRLAHHLVHAYQCESGGRQVNPKTILLSHPLLYRLSSCHLPDT